MRYYTCTCTILYLLIIIIRAMEFYDVAYTFRSAIHWYIYYIIQVFFSVMQTVLQLNNIQTIQSCRKTRPILMTFQKTHFRHYRCPVVILYNKIQYKCYSYNTLTKLTCVRLASAPSKTICQKTTSGPLGSLVTQIIAKSQVTYFEIIRTPSSHK